MEKSIVTNGIKVKVRPSYEIGHSAPSLGKFVFSYKVWIENVSKETVQLVNRYWIIKDGTGKQRIVKGPGVIGLQPILEPGQQHIYNSWCPLRTDLGTMKGAFEMMNIDTKEYFDAEIPEFKLVADFKYN